MDLHDFENKLFIVKRRTDLLPVFGITFHIKHTARGQNYTVWASHLSDCHNEEKFYKARGLIAGLLPWIALCLWVIILKVTLKNVLNYFEF